MRKRPSPAQRCSRTHDSHLCCRDDLRLSDVLSYCSARPVDRDVEIVHRSYLPRADEGGRCN
jgi:hypothetical protein